jgi:hypothetical protein
LTREYPLVTIGLPSGLHQQAGAIAGPQAFPGFPVNEDVVQVAGMCCEFDPNQRLSYVEQKGGYL